MNLSFKYDFSFKMSFISFLAWRSFWALGWEVQTDHLQSNHRATGKTTALNWCLFKWSRLKYHVNEQYYFCQGDASNMRKLTTWLQNWAKNHSGPNKKGASKPPPWNSGADNGFWAKAALLSGPPGTTTRSNLSLNVTCLICFSSFSKSSTNLPFKFTIRSVIIIVDH